MAGIEILGDLGKLSEPVTALVHRIFGSAEKALEPWHLERMARAKVKADRISALGEVETMAATERALRRLAAEATADQLNLEAVVEMALPNVNADADTAAVSEAWLRTFVDSAKLATDEAAQELWAQVLAGEANSPGAFGKRALTILASLEQRDAEVFEALISCSIGDEGALPIVFDVGDEVYAAAGITFENLLDLEQLGLLTFDGLTGFNLQNQPAQVIIKYISHHALLSLRSPEEGNSRVLEVGSVVLTRPGKELARIVSPRELTGFMDYILGKWEGYGHEVSRQM